MFNHELWLAVAPFHKVIVFEGWLLCASLKLTFRPVPISFTLMAFLDSVLGCSMKGKGIGLKWSLKSF